MLSNLTATEQSVLDDKTSEFRARILELPEEEQIHFSGNFHQLTKVDDNMDGVYYSNSFAIDTLREHVKSRYPFSDEAQIFYQRMNAIIDDTTINETEQSEQLEQVRNEMQKATQGNPNDFGVADTVEQILERWPMLEQSDRRFILTIMPVFRADQGEYGWRWHKWGEYIGTQEPQHEYLADETHIDSVLVFQIVELSPA